MISRFRLSAPAIGLVTMLLAGCGQSVPATTPTAAAGSPVPSIVARDAYNNAICPIFTGILEVDPRLAALRSAGAAGGDISAQSGELEAVGDDLGSLLEELESVPEWSEGANLRFQLITALHGIRALVLDIGGDPGAPTAAEALATLPFISSEAMDIAMQTAITGGLDCEGAS